MAVHRISDSAEAALKRIARREGKKPGEILSQLVIDYENGLEFQRGNAAMPPTTGEPA